jgi:hypothetical protein
MEYLDSLAYGLATGLALGAFGVVVYELVKVPLTIKVNPKPKTRPGQPPNPETQTKTQPVQTKPEEKTRQIFPEGRTVADFQCRFCRLLVDTTIIREEKGCKKFEYAWSKQVCNFCVHFRFELKKSTSPTCRTCFETFTNRSKLFVHLRAENHQKGCIVPECDEDCLDVSRF